MKTGWLLSAMIIFVVGFLFSTSAVGIIIGLPLMIISIVILTIGIILPDVEKPTKKVKKTVKKR